MNPKPTAIGEGVQPQSTLADMHPLVDSERTTGPGYYLTARSYGTGDTEIVGIRLNTDQGLNKGGGAKRRAKSKTESDPEVQAKSMQRARTTIRRRILSMQADRLLTLTFRANVTDLGIAYKCFDHFRRLMRWRFGGSRWCYVAAPEFQERGAVHFHLAVRGFYPVKTVREFWRRAAGEYGGNIDITSPRNIKKQSWNPRRIAQYLSKYVGKLDSVEFNRKRYSSGGEIVIPPAVTGWLALGVSVGQIMRQIIDQLSHKPVSVVWETEDRKGLVYMST